MSRTQRPRVKLDHLVAFIATAERKNIDDAAGQLGLSASGVRKQLDILESTFDIRLFERCAGCLNLTEDGAMFYEGAIKTIEQVLLLEEQVGARRAIRNHRLFIGHSTNLPPRLIAAIMEVHIDDIQPVHIEHTSGLTSTTVRRVINGSLHMGFGTLPICAPELLIHTIYEEPMVLCLPTGHRLALKPIVSPQELDGEPFIAVSREPWPERHQEIEDHCSDFGVKLRIVADAYLPSEALAHVERKMGICMLPTSSVHSRPGIVLKPLSTHVLKRRCGMFVREDHNSPLLQKLIDAAIRQMSGLRLKRGPVSVGLSVHEDLRK